MKAAHDLLKESYPDLTPRQLDVAFIEYGKVKFQFPSWEATAAELRERRELTQKQASIDRLKKTGR